MLACLKKSAVWVISVVTIAVTAACQTPIPPATDVDKEVSKHTTVTYSYDAKDKHWVTDINVDKAASGNGNYNAARDNTLIIQLQANTPVQEIVIDEGFVTGGAAPILDIDGNPADSDNGTIRIGTLTLDTVDARRLQIRDTQVVSSNVTNVVAQDNELELNFTTVAVVFVERGASSNLTLKNFRVDRIRILGAGSNTDTHLERLTITNSGFVGTIRIEDAKIDSLFLTDISLEE